MIIHAVNHSHNLSFFSINIKMFSLFLHILCSKRGGDWFHLEKKSSPKSVAVKFCSKRLKKEFETAVVNEPSVFEPFKFKFYCSMFSVTSVDQKCNTYTILHQFLCLVTSHVAKVYLFFCDID